MLFALLKGIIDHFVLMMNTIPRIESELGKSNNTVSHKAYRELRGVFS